MDECIEWQHYRNRYGYGRSGDHLVHRRAFEEYWGVILPPGLMVLHECDNPACYRVSHLYIGTHQDNMRDKVARNRQGKGSKIPQAKLTEQFALEAMAWLLAGQSQGDVAVAFGVSQTTIGALWRGETWGYLFSTTLEQRQAMLAELRRQLASEGHKRTLSPAHRESMAAVRRGRKHSAETRARIAERHRGKPLSQDHRAKLSESGRLSEAVRKAAQSRSRAANGRFVS